MKHIPDMIPDSAYSILGVMENPYEYDTLKKVFSEHSTIPRYITFKRAVTNYTTNSRPIEIADLDRNGRMEPTQPSGRTQIEQESIPSGRTFADKSVEPENLEIAGVALNDRDPQFRSALADVNGSVQSLILYDSNVFGAQNAVPTAAIDNSGVLSLKSRLLTDTEVSQILNGEGQTTLTTSTSNTPQGDPDVITETRDNNDRESRCVAYFVTRVEFNRRAIISESSTAPNMEANVPRNQPSSSSAPDLATAPRSTFPLSSFTGNIDFASPISRPTEPVTASRPYREDGAEVELPTLVEGTHEIAPVRARNARRNVNRLPKALEPRDTVSLLMQSPYDLSRFWKESGPIVDLSGMEIVIICLHAKAGQNSPDFSQLFKFVRVTGVEKEEDLIKRVGFKNCEKHMVSEENPHPSAEIETLPQTATEDSSVHPDSPRTDPCPSPPPHIFQCETPKYQYGRIEFADRTLPFLMVDWYKPGPAKNKICIVGGSRDRDRDFLKTREYHFHSDEANRYSMQANHIRNGCEKTPDQIQFKSATDFRTRRSLKNKDGTLFRLYSQHTRLHDGFLSTISVFGEGLLRRGKLLGVDELTDEIHSKYGHRKD